MPVSDSVDLRSATLTCTAACCVLHSFALPHRAQPCKHNSLDPPPPPPLSLPALLLSVPNTQISPAIDRNSDKPCLHPPQLMRTCNLKLTSDLTHPSQCGPRTHMQKESSLAFCAFAGKHVKQAESPAEGPQLVAGTHSSSRHSRPYANLAFRHGAIPC